MDRSIKDKLPDWAKYVEADKPVDDRIVLEPAIVYPLFFEKLGWNDSIADLERLSERFEALTSQAEADIAQMTAEAIAGKSVEQIKGILEQVAEKAEEIKLRAIEEYKNCDKGSVTQARFECARRCFTEALFEIAAGAVDIRIVRDNRYKLLFFPEGKAILWRSEYRRIKAA